ncbi:MAG TPA: hypothetical protein VFI09_09765 [Solirubrobacterales bacterium]|nr:hypothetical protein [Solirubrobacterales bacterium]
MIGSGPAGLSSSRRLEGAGDVHAHQRRRLLYDHLQRLQDLAAQIDLSLAFERVDAAAARLEPLSPASA